MSATRVENIITVHVECQDDKSNQTFTMNKTTRFGKLIDAYCEKFGFIKQRIRFLYDGQNILEHFTPQSMEMEDVDTINVYFSQPYENHIRELETKYK